MNMLRSLNKLRGYRVQALDGEIGKVSEFYFDDESWVVRYVVVAVGPWLARQKVLISPFALLQPIWGERLFPVSITRKQVEESPDIDTDKPVERQHEIELHRHFAWDYYWNTESYRGDPSVAPPYLTSEERKVNQGGTPFDTHLHTTRLVTGYHIQATDGDVGHISDFIADDFSWVIRYLVIDTKVVGREQHLFLPDLVDSLRFGERKVHVKATREQVFSSPPFNPSDLVNRGEEEVVCDYYGRPYLPHGETRERSGG